MNILNLLVTDHTFRTVALGCSLLGMVSGILGCFAVLRKQSLLGDAVSHASLPGVCLAFLFTNVKNTEVLLLGALISGIICIGLIQLIQNYTKIKFDSALALILSVFFGLGLVLLSYMNKLPGANKSGLNKFIFGQASTFIKRDVDIIFITGIILLIIIILFWKEFKIVSFDSDFAKTLGFPSKKIEILMVGKESVKIISEKFGNKKYKNVECYSIIHPAARGRHSDQVKKQWITRDYKIMGNVYSESDKLKEVFTVSRTLTKEI